MQLPPMLKGHGTQNDFLVLPDLDGELDLSAELVRALCDRHAGIGADGVLRVVRAEMMPDLAPDPAPGIAAARYAMDYRNADGSTSEMCGNGIRVFMRYLQLAGLAGSELTVATRGGLRRVHGDPDGDLTAEMGAPAVLDVRPVVSARPLAPVTGVALQVPNPHVVVTLGEAADLDTLDLSRPPSVEPALPSGQNVEFVVERSPRHLAMRVHERGVGETRSCGTGICAAVVARAIAGGTAADGATWRVDVPGGSCWVRWRTDGELELTGPAVLVAEVSAAPEWLAAIESGGRPVPGLTLR
jgi:diaminopimelate epimerase